MMSLSIFLQSFVNCNLQIKTIKNNRKLIPISKFTQFVFRIQQFIFAYNSKIIIVYYPVGFCIHIYICTKIFSFWFNTLSSHDF